MHGCANERDVALGCHVMSQTRLLSLWLMTQIVAR